MATVTGITAARALAIEAATITDGSYDSGGHLILTKHDGTQVDAGAVPTATTGQAGIVELATNTDVAEGTSTNTAITPSALITRVATEVLAGLVELATTSEATTGTDTAKAVTPAGLTAAIASALSDALDTSYKYVSTIYYDGNGTFTKADYPGIRAVRVRCVGGGGGGGGAKAAASSQHASGGGGGGGGYAESFLLASALGASETVTVGLGGVGVSAQSGTTGGESSFGSLCSAWGGDPGSVGNSVATAAIGQGGWGGTLGIGDLGADGDTGSPGVGYASIGIGGNGGGSQLGGSPKADFDATAAASLGGRDAFSYGAGACGAASNAGGAANIGGDGYHGVVIVEVFQ